MGKQRERRAGLALSARAEGQGTGMGSQGFVLGGSSLLQGLGSVTCLLEEAGEEGGMLRRPHP